ncbi:MAG: M20 family peptidase, partial [Candidatus Bipolaricaulota bacterium]|nr:M20 family peptidase [Candidatus Bipolaricaulota bacterium]
MNDQAIEAKKATVEKAIDRLSPKLIELAERIHEHPETKFEEVKAAQWLSQAAEEAGFVVENPVGGLDTAFRATWVGSGKGPVVAFLAEYDALPKIGHACGHNLIGTASLGAALGLAKGLGSLPGTMQLIGTPGEEGGGGKVILSEAGVFEGVDAAMMFHPAG